MYTENSHRKPDITDSNMDFQISCNERTRRHFYSVLLIDKKIMHSNVFPIQILIEQDVHFLMIQRKI